MGCSTPRSPGSASPGPRARGRFRRLHHNTDRSPRIRTPWVYDAPAPPTEDRRMPGPIADLARETIAPDEQATTAEFVAFLKAASAARHPTGQIPRFNQGRHSGCVEAEFTVVNGLHADLKVGLFQQPRSYSAWIRFANAASASDREKDVRGMSIKVRGVRGENLTQGQRRAGLRAEQPSGDDGAGTTRVPRAAAGRRSWRSEEGDVFPLASARRRAPRSRRVSIRRAISTSRTGAPRPINSVPAVL